MICFNTCVFAENCEIEADVLITSGCVKASGKISGVNLPCTMMLMVFENGENYTKENLVCIGSTSTDEEGNFEIVSNAHKGTVRNH